MKISNITWKRSKTTRKRSYTTRISIELLEFHLYIYKTYYEDPYPELRIACAELKEDSLRCKDCEHIVNIIMYLLFKYAYPIDSEYGKFTIHYSMKTNWGVVTFAIGKAITFRVGGINKPVRDIVDEYVRVKAEEYGDAVLMVIFIRIYYVNILSSVQRDFSEKQIASLLAESVESDAVAERIAVRKIDNRKHKYLKHITTLKSSCKEKRPFIVADTETVLIEKVHMPYAVGFLVVDPGVAPSEETVGSIETYFSEDNPVYLFDTIRKRSNKMLSDFIERLAVVVRKNPSIHTIYFHNLARFDGILFLKYFASYDTKYTFKPLMKDRQLYELVIYRDKKLLLRLRDSLKLLPSKLDDLAQNLCPHLGRKGFIQHNKVEESNLIHRRKELLEYMKQDILLLGGVMHTAQAIYYSQFKIDIVKKRTLSALALDIYRSCYYDQNNWPIYIPDRNEDTFIRRGYYGGHSDTYIPIGKELYYYDVNSLYPYVMKNYPMPGGEPVWQGNCEGMDLDNMFGFIEAYIVCPSDMKRPFLPYKSSKKTLIFPTGEFVGVYYSEELKYARSIGYQVTPLSGYMFQKMNPCSPFREFVSSLFESRLEAKKEGHNALAFVYKILMNSLYGRFGINPESTVTEICSYNRYLELIRTRGFVNADKFSDEYYIVTYKTNTEQVPDIEWNPPKIAAVQMAAAITACARIHMYPFISREDCHYTDTDSVLLRGRLPDEVISSTEMGKFKLEYASYDAVCLAAKDYCLFNRINEDIIKHKGLTKALVNREWYLKQYENLNRTIHSTVVLLFHINWKTLEIGEKPITVNLGTPTNTKREAVYDNNKAWVDTKPLNVIDYAGQDKRVLEYQKSVLKKEVDRLNDLLASMSQTSDDPKKSTIQTQGLSQSTPTLYNHPPKKNKKKHMNSCKKKKKKPG